MKFNISPSRPQSVAIPASTAVEKKRPLVVFVIAGKSFTPGFFDSWFRFLMSMTNNERPFNIGMYRCYTPEIYHCRIYAVGGHPLKGPQQIPWQGEVPYDYMFWLDTDIVFTPEQVLALYNRMERQPEVDVLSGVYLMQNALMSTVVADWDDDFFNENGHYKLYTPEELQELKQKRSDGLVQSFAAGMGFMIIRKGVFERIRYPWFGPRYHERYHTCEFASEDISWCANLKDAGINVYVDPDVMLGHEKTKIL